MLAGAMASYQRLARPSNEATLRTHAAAGAASLRPAPPPRFKGGKRARPERDCDDGAWEYDGAEEDEDGDGREPARGAAGQPAQPAEGGAHQKRMLRAEQNFRAQLPRWQYTQRALSPRLARHRQAQISANLALVEQLVDEFAAEPVLPTCSCGGGKGYRLLAERREVLYRGAAAGCFGMLRVPMFACAACDERQEMPACAAGCCGNTPVSGSIWFDQMLLNLHAQLTPLGVSSTNFAQALDSAARSFRSMECGVQYAPVLDDRGLSWATSAQRTAMRGLEDASQLVPEVALFTGLFGYCPVCAKVPDAPACSCQAAPAAAAGSSRTESGLSGAAIPETEQAPVEASAETSAAEPAPSGGGRQHGVPADGSSAGASSAAAAPDICSTCAGVNCAASQAPVGERRPILLNSDGVVKGGHFESRGTSITAAWEEGKLPPINSDFIDGPSSAQSMLGRFLDPAAPRGLGDSACTAHLSCSRPVAAGNSTVKDVECFAGAVCGCGVPVKGVFLSCPRSECFAIYDAQLATVEGALRHRGEQQIAALMLDISCRYGPSFRARWPSVLPELRYYVGWMHSRAGHNLACQLEFGGEYATGLGRCIGEAIERLWVSFKARVGRVELIQGDAVPWNLKNPENPGLKNSKNP